MKKLFLDDVRQPWDDSWDVVRNYHDFVQWIRENGLPSVISFDHDLSPEHYKNEMFSGTGEDYNALYKKFEEKTGLDCAKWLCEHVVSNEMDFPRFNVHSMNPVGAKNIANLLSNYSLFYREEDIGNVINPYQRGYQEQ